MCCSLMSAGNNVIAKLLVPYTVNLCSLFFLSFSIELTSAALDSPAAPGQWGHLKDLKFILASWWCSIIRINLGALLHSWTSEPKKSNSVAFCVASWKFKSVYPAAEGGRLWKSVPFLRNSYSLSVTSSPIEKCVSLVRPKNILYFTGKY